MLGCSAEVHGTNKLWAKINNAFLLRLFMSGIVTAAREGPTTVTTDTLNVAKVVSK